jgi:hypothetical protein
MIFKKKRNQKINPRKDSWNQPKTYHEEKKTYSLALVLDNEVQDIIRTEERLWALLLSGAAIIDITDLEIQPRINWMYDEETDAFEDPNAISPTNEESEVSKNEDKTEPTE